MDQGGRIIVRLFGRAIGASIALVLLAAGPRVRAQATADDEALRRRLRAEEAEHQRREAAPSVRTQEVAPPLDGAGDALPVETPCFEIRQVVVDGAPAGLGWVRRHARRYQGQCIGQQGLNLIARRLGQELLADGKVTTRLGLPEQALSSGELHLVVVPGTLRRVTLADDRGPRVTWWNALPLRRGELIDVRDLDQGLEQLKRLPSQDVEIALRPGDLPGESDVELKVTRTRRWRTSLTVDDGGSSSTGKHQGTLTASLDDALWLNDVLSLSGQHDADFRPSRHASWGASGSWTVPYGYWTLSLSAGTNRYTQKVAGGTIDFTYRGRSTNADVSLERVIHRSQGGKTTATLGFGRRWARTWLNDVEIEVQRRNTTSASLGLSHRQAIGPATLDASLEVRRGLPWLAQRDPAKSDPSSGTTRFTLGVLDGSLTLPVRLGQWTVRYRNHSRYQYTRDHLLVADAFAIGGRYTVRGFDGDETLAAERGWYSRNDLGVTLPVVQQELYVAADYGRVAGPSSARLPGIVLAGAAVGLRGGWKLLSYDVFAGRPLHAPRRFHTARFAIGFSATVQY